MILFRRVNPDKRTAELAHAMVEAGNSILEYDYIDLAEAFIRTLADDMKHIISGSYDATLKRLDKLLDTARKNLLPIASPYNFLDTAKKLVDATREEGLPLSRARERVLTLGRVVLEYLASARRNAPLSLNYLVESGSSVLTLGYTRLHMSTFLLIRNRLSVINTIYLRPYMPGRKLAVELIKKGVEAYAWPDTDLAHALERSSHVILFTPGIDKSGLAALDPGSIATMNLAEELEKNIIIVSDSLSIVDESFSHVLERKVEVKSKTLNMTLSLAPFEYTPLTRASTLVTESGIYHSPTLEMLNDIRNRTYATLVQETLRIAG